MGSVGYGPGYGVGFEPYGAKRDGVAMKREEGEMSGSFSVRKEDLKEEAEEAVEAEEEGNGGAKRGG